MKRRRGKGGLSNLAVGAIWALVAIGVVLAAIQAMGANSIEDVMYIAQNKAAEYAECIPSGECGIGSIIKDIGSGSSGGSGLADVDQEDLDNIDSPNDSENDNIDVDNPSSVELVDRETKGYRGPGKGEPYVNNAGLVAKSAAISLLEEITVAESTKVEYDRSEWKHWSGTPGRSCWNTREEVLHRDAEEGTVLYVDKQMNSTTNYEEACAIGSRIEDKSGKIKIDTKNSGEWVDPYSGRSITSSSDIDIDHVIPLSYAAENGGQSWDEDLKETFANDLDNLLATSAKENRKKGAKGPSDYMPPYKGYRCQYAKTFTNVAHKYGLTMPEKDINSLTESLENCQF